jgi:hypothetical protein
MRRLWARVVRVVRGAPRLAPLRVEAVKVFGTDRAWCNMVHADVE